MKQDSSRPEFWDSRFRDGITPWDAAGVPLLLATWIKHRKPCRVLIPGCGTGYEVRLFAEHGHEVLAIDFSDAAIEAAKRQLGALADRVRKADFFGFEGGPFDLVYERAFLCALPRWVWPQWAARAAELVCAQGGLAGFFYLDDNDRGPPFGITQDYLSSLLDASFQLTENRSIPAAQSLPVFQGKEHWQVWRRKP